ncbi:MAG: hypothetical protein OEY49_16300, partial [Candidatus Heimdallarchaeota archaeon]|nr:hypothetical protein [Candidatus Heimdallarchaeota archaeon]
YDRISEDNSNILREEINIKTRRALENISLDYYKILFWGLLTGTHLRYPKTDSIDINENLLIIGEFFSIKYCTPLDPSCTYHITFDSSKLKFKTNFANPRNLIKDTDILRSLLIKVKNKQYLELKILLLSYLETLKTFTAIALRYNKDDKKIIHEIENLRYLSGMEIEHYMMIRLKRESELIYNILKTETQAIEWMNSW